MKALKRFLQRFRNATTPMAWKKYRNQAALLGAAIAAGWGAASNIPGVTIPEGWGTWIAGAIGALAFFVVIAQGQETPAVEQKNDQAEK